MAGVGVTSTIGRLTGAPGDLLGALRLLPSIADNTAAMADATAVLPEVQASLAGALQVLETMDGRMATIEAAMPVLVEAQGAVAYGRAPSRVSRPVGPAHSTTFAEEGAEVAREEVGGLHGGEVAAAVEL